MSSTDRHLGVDAATTLESADAMLDTAAIGWMLICTFLVISMQLGFAMLEVGSVRKAHRMTVLAKNVLDSCVSSIAFWSSVQWYAPDVVTKDGEVELHLVLFHWAYCATAVTICSGAMAERTNMVAYLFHAAVVAAIVYPHLADSVWGSGSGILYDEFHSRVGGQSYHDFAGSGVIHLAGGCAALVGNALLGRRIMHVSYESDLASSVNSMDPHVALPGSRWEAGFIMDPDPSKLASPSQWPRRFDDSRRDEHEFATCPYLQVMGTFTLWIGWYGFNTGSTLVTGSMNVGGAGLVAWNTSLAAAGAGFGAYIFCCTFRKHLNVSFLCNGVLSGLVAVTAACDVATEPFALGLGVTAGLVVYPLSSKALKWLHLDDPVDAIAVHACSGLLGVLAVGLVRPNCSRLRLLGPLMPAQAAFCEAEHGRAEQLLVQAYSAFVIIAATISVSVLTWMIFLISERARAFQVEHVVEAQKLVLQLRGCGAAPSAAGGAAPAGGAAEPVPAAEDAEQGRPEPSGEVIAQLRDVARRSPIARRVLQRHGWSWCGFPDGAPGDVELLCSEMHQACCEEAETALELEVPRPFYWLARMAYACWPTRELLSLRLRISPSAELSGLGATDTDISLLGNLLWRSVYLLTQTRTTNSPLKREVAQLTEVVQSQEIMLQALMRNRRFKAWRSRNLQSVPEQPVAAVGNGAGKTWGENPAPQAIGSTLSEQDSARGSRSSHSEEFARRGGAAAEASTNAVRTPSSSPPNGSGLEDLSLLLSRRQALPDARRSITVSGTSSDRTVSDRSAGNLSPRSANEETPPPTVMNFRTRGQGGQGAQTQEVAAQLVNMLQAQQHLLTALQAATGGSSTPTSQHGQQQPPPPLAAPAPAPAPSADAAAHLMAALQQVMAQQATYPPSSRTSSTV